MMLNIFFVAPFFYLRGFRRRVFTQAMIDGERDDFSFLLFYPIVRQQQQRHTIRATGHGDGEGGVFFEMGEGRKNIIRHPRLERGSRVIRCDSAHVWPWIPAYAGMTGI